jgi:hypothetical protein
LAVSSLYIVHSSKDRAAAVELKARLESKGYRSAFLDCDPEQGIQPGRQWEKELYANMRRCRAAIVVCSPHLLESKWCFAEIAHCKALGKEILPIRIAGDADHPLLHSIQAIDVAAEGEQAYERLWRRLEGEALWPADRPPYPGLRAFDERDAPVFLGRRDDVRAAHEILNRLQLSGHAAGLLVIGPSGSGKSSLVRAGLLPELRRDEANWLVVGPWRPFDDPRATLVSAVAAAFHRYTGSSPSFDQIEERLRAGLAPACRELRRQAGKPEATVVVIVDQMEELISYRARNDDGPPGDRRCAIEPGASGFLLLGTPRRFSASFSAKQVVFAPDSKSLVIADDFGRLDIHALEDDRLVESWPKQDRGIECVVFSPDGRILAVAPFEGGVLLQDLHERKPLGILNHVHAVPSVAFDADGGRLATACLDGKVRIWHITDRERGPRVLRGGLEGLDHVEFSADGRCLLTVNRKDEAHLWHSDRVGEPVRVPAWEHGAVRRARLSPNGDSILVQADLAAYLLPLKWEKLRSALLRRTRVRLTTDERELYLGETAS